MICCRRAAACAATMCTEAAARQVNPALPPVSGKGPSVSTTYTVHGTDSRYCADKAALGHALIEDMHISFLIEDYREELESRIAKSVDFKTLTCTLFNMSLGPPVGAPLGVRAPLEPIKGRACSLEHKFS
jgi:hypothetical protein